MILIGKLTEIIGRSLFCFFIKDEGGMITLTDVYCRFNRARGMEVCQFSMDFFFYPHNEKTVLPCPLHRNPFGLSRAPRMASQKNVCIEG